MYTVSNRFRPENIHELGTFQVKSGEMMVSDPCYSRDTWCQGILKNVKNGEWVAYVEKGQTDWGNRCWSVYVVHSDYPQTNHFTQRVEFEVGVDSGQAGFFDNAKYHGGEDRYGEDGWYDICCKATLDSKLGANVIDGGVVSSSGFGDGSYHCHVAKIGNQIIGAKITFISEEDFGSDADFGCDSLENDNTGE